MNFLRENEADFEYSFDGNDNGKLQSILDYFIQKLSNGLQRRGEGGENGVNFHVYRVNDMSKQTSKKKTLSFGFLSELSYKWLKRSSSCLM